MSFFPDYRGSLGRAEDDGPALGKPPGPELEEEFEKYKKELRADGGFGVTSPYGDRLVKGIRCVASENRSDPTLQELIQFAIDRFNRSIERGEGQLPNSLQSDLSLHHAKDYSRWLGKSCIRRVYTCYTGCKLWSAIFIGHSDEADRAFYKDRGETYKVGRKLLSRENEKLTMECCERLRTCNKRVAECFRYLRGVEVLEVTVADSSKAVEHVEQQSQPRHKKRKVRKEIYCQHVLDATSTEIRRAPYMVSTLVPLEKSYLKKLFEKSVGEADFTEVYFFQTLGKPVGLEDMWTK